MATINYTIDVCAKLLATQKDLRDALNAKAPATRISLLLSKLYGIRSQAQDLLLDKELHNFDHDTLNFLVDLVKNTQSLYLQLVKDAENYLLASLLARIK